MEQDLCFFCKKDQKSVVSQTNCKHQVEVPDCGLCDSNRDFCHLCAATPVETVNQPQDPAIHSFLYLINTTLNERVAFLVINFNSQSQASEIIRVCAKQKEEDYMVYEYAGITPISPREFLVTGGEVEQGTTKECYFLRFERIGEVYQFLVERIPDLLVERYAHKAFAVGPNVFLVAGGQQKGRKLLQTSEIYQDGVWKAGPNLQRPRSQASGLVFKGHAYLFGGFSGPKVQETSFERINTKTLDSWEEIKVSNIEKLCLSGVLSIPLGDSILLLGGSDGKRSSPQLLVWNVEKGVIETKENMMKERVNAGGLLLEGSKVLVLGGERENEVKVEILGLEKKLECEVTVDDEENPEKRCPFNVPGYYWFPLN